MTTPATKILVTGASGFLGSRLVRQLVASGEHVKAFVRATASRRALEGLPADHVEIVEGDIQVGHTIYRALAGCDRMVHAAASVKLWDKHPARITDAAVVGTEQALDAAKKRGLRAIVHVSSTVTLGTAPAPSPMDETDVFNVADPDVYAAAKVRADEVVRSYVAAGLPIVSALPSTIVGPGDYRPSAFGALLLRYLRWDTSWMRFPSFEGGLNIVDVDDVARGVGLCLSKGKAGERYVLGGDDVTYTELLETLSNLTGLPGPAKVSSKGFAELVGRFSELSARLLNEDALVSRKTMSNHVGAFRYVSSAKAENELGYTHRPAREALARAVRDFLANGLIPVPQAQRIRIGVRVA